MSSRLFKRKAQLIIGKIGSEGVKIDGLRFSFEIKMTDTKETNKGNIVIYGLSRETMGILEQKDASIFINIGYDDEELSTLFIGNIVEFEPREEENSIAVEVTCRDGWIPLSSRKLSLSFAPKSTTKQILNRIIAELNLTKGDYSALPDYIYEQGFSFIGAPGTALNTVLARIGYEWTIVNNTLVISQDNKSPNETIMQFLSPTTGLLSKPSRFKDKAVKTKVQKNKLLDGWKIKSLIIPSIQPKSLISVESEAVQGTFLVKAVKFVGDTHDNNWFAEIDAIQKN
jgi:hypothetical protein